MKQGDLETGILLKEILKAKKHKNIEELGEKVALLIKIEPARWIIFLYREKVVPHPRSSNYSDSMSLLLHALQTAIEANSLEPKLMLQLVLPLVSLNSKFSLIRARLEKLDVWGDNALEVVFRIAAFLQDQSRLSLKEDSLLANGVHFPLLAMSDELSTMSGGANSNITSAIESIAENLQLVLSYVHQKKSSDFFDIRAPIKSPYFDGEFSKLLALATSWREYEFLWENIVFLGWTPRVLSDEKPIQIYEPPVVDELKRYKISDLRRVELNGERATQFYSIFKPSSKVTEKIAASIAPPSFGKLWDGNYDVQALRDEFVRSKDYLYYRVILEDEYLDKISHEVLFGEEGKNVNWSVYLSAIGCLSVFTDAFSRAVEAKRSVFKNYTVFDQLLIAEKTELASLISSIADMTEEQALLAIDVLVFKSKFSKIEIWDAPLIEIDETRVLLIPVLIQIGDRMRSLENAISQWNDNIFAKRGKLLEKDIRDFLLRQGINVQASVKFSTNNYREVECDLVVYWDGYLILIEAKVTKSAIKASEVYRVKERLEKAEKQLHIRQNEILANWDIFRQVAADLNLPDTPPHSNYVRKIALTNVFT